MVFESQKEEDLEEIFSHIKELKKQQEQFNEGKEDNLEPINLIKESAEKIAGELDVEYITDEDLFEIVEPVEKIIKTKKEISEKPVVQIDDSIGSGGLCDICQTDFLFEKNLSGLVINGKFFACESCCQKASKDDLDHWTESKMAKPTDVKPIALWLMEHQNKTRLIE
jgi:hypothetical protein